MSDVVIRPALQAERGLEALQWRASLANPGDRDSLLANPDAIALPVEQIADGHVFVAEREGVIVGFAAVLRGRTGMPSSMRCSSSRASGNEAWGDCWSTIAPIRARARFAHPARRRQPARGRLLCRVRLPHDRDGRDPIRHRSRDAARALTPRLSTSVAAFGRDRTAFKRLHLVRAGDQRNTPACAPLGAFLNFVAGWCILVAMRQVSRPDAPQPSKVSAHVSGEAGEARRTLT